MADYIRHELPRRHVDGTTSVYCRTCGREIARRLNSQIRSVKECAICVLRAQGVENPEEHVLPQYIMFDATRPPVPLQKADDIFLLFPEEENDEFKLAPSAGGVVGTLKNIFRVLGLTPDATQKPEPPKSKTTARERRRTTLFDPIKK